MIGGLALLPQESIMTDMLLGYVLFFAETLTVVVGLGALIGLVAALARRDSGTEHLEVRCMNRALEDLERSVRREVLPAKRYKADEKARKKAEKARAKSHSQTERRRIFVLNFRGDIKASAVASLRHEVTAVLSTAKRGDEVLLRLENSGGLVHEHGLAASQLLRLRERSIPLTVAVDKVAASGGYMMACVADRVVAAPFAILGSIGVLLQLPNFRRMLDCGGVDFEQIKGGEFKRTLTLFGSNTEAERTAAQAQVDDTHALFKEFVSEYRPDLSIDRIATGEHWYGKRALALKLCDELTTSDDYLLAASENADLFELRYVIKKKLGGKLIAAVDAAFEYLVLRLPFASSASIR